MDDQKQGIHRLVTSFPQWKELQAEYEGKNKLISRIFANLTPVAMINQTLYIEYSGKAEYKEAVEKAYSENQLEIKSAVLRVLGASVIASSAKLDQAKLAWLEKLFEAYAPKSVSFNIFK
jgi:hypothetical protein